MTKRLLKKLKARFKNVEKAIKIIPDGNTLLSKDHNYGYQENGKLILFLQKISR